MLHTKFRQNRLTDYSIALAKVVVVVTNEYLHCRIFIERKILGIDGRIAKVHVQYFYKGCVLKWIQCRKKIMLKQIKH